MREAPILDFSVVVALLARRDACRHAAREAKYRLDAAREERDAAQAAIAKIEAALAEVFAAVPMKFDAPIELTPRPLTIDDLIARLRVPSA